MAQGGDVVAAILEQKERERGMRTYHPEPVIAIKRIPLPPKSISLSPWSLSAGDGGGGFRQSILVSIILFLEITLSLELSLSLADRWIEKKWEIWRLRVFLVCVVAARSEGTTRLCTRRTSPL